MSSKTFVCCLLTVLCCLFEVRAESRFKRFLMKADSILTDRYYHTPYDTNYVARPEGKLAIQIKGNQSGNSIRGKGTVNDLYFKSRLTTNHKTTISIGAAYRGISGSYSINPAKLRGFYDDYEVALNYYGSRFCIDGYYQRSSSLSGNIHYGDETYRMKSDYSRMKMFNITAYYIFNHRRYSVAAPFSQSYIQRRSAGSWLAGLSYQGGNVRSSDEFREAHPDRQDVRLGFGHLGIGGGYGYNLVLRKKWLLHVSLLPCFVVYNHNSISVDGERITSGHMKFDMLFNEKAAVVYNFSPRYFAGLNAVARSSLFTDKIVTVHQSKWAAHAFVGMRLWK